MRPLRPQSKEPAFLTICWGLPRAEKGTMQATLCLANRRQIAGEYPEVWGCGQLGDSCDLCEGHTPRRPMARGWPSATLACWSRLPGSTAVAGSSHGRRRGGRTGRVARSLPPLQEFTAVPAEGCPFFVLNPHCRQAFMVVVPLP